MTERATIELAELSSSTDHLIVSEQRHANKAPGMRQEVRPFTDKQIEVVQNFAAQAVIAIEHPTP